MSDRRTKFQSFPPGAEWTDYQFIPNADGKDLTYFNPSDTNWVGAPINKEQVSDFGKFVTLGPAPIGWPAYLEAVVLLAGLKKLTQTPEGLRVIRDIATHYVDGISKVLVAMHQSSSSHVITGLVNQYVACGMYQRLGLMSPHDALQAKAWIDHQIGENLKESYIMGAMGHITTLVNSTNESRGGKESESTAGLATLAKVLTP